MSRNRTKGDIHSKNCRFCNTGKKTLTMQSAESPFFQVFGKGELIERDCRPVDQSALARIFRKKLDRCEKHAWC